MTQEVVAEPSPAGGWIRIGLLFLATVLSAALIGLLLISERALSINIFLHKHSLWPTPTLNGKKVSLGKDWYPFIQVDESDVTSPQAKLVSATFLRVNSRDKDPRSSVTLFFSEEASPQKTVEREEQWPRLGRVLFLDRRQTKSMLHYTAWIESQKIFVSADSEDDLRMALNAIDENA
ncbi:MAG: hypothetical protein JNK75_09610 [Betaproteobacteria bacterium]|nr:hypothetical protein [Betaproteobacteria bacterium]